MGPCRGDCAGGSCSADKGAAEPLLPPPLTLDDVDLASGAVCPAAPAAALAALGLSFSPQLPLAVPLPLCSQIGGSDGDFGLLLGAEPLLLAATLAANAAAA